MLGEKNDRISEWPCGIWTVLVCVDIWLLTGLLTGLLSRKRVRWMLSPADAHRPAVARQTPTGRRSPGRRPPAGGRPAEFNGPGRSGINRRDWSEINIIDNIFRILAGPIVSWLVNKYGCRAVAITGAVVSSVGLGISVLATNVTTLYVTVGVVAGNGWRVSVTSLTANCCWMDGSRSRVRIDVSSGHRERDDVFRGQAVVRHRHRRLRLRSGDIRLRAPVRVAHQLVPLDGRPAHPGRHRAQWRHLRRPLPTHRTQPGGAQRWSRGNGRRNDREGETGPGGSVQARRGRVRSEFQVGMRRHDGFVPVQRSHFRPV